MGRIVVNILLALTLFMTRNLIYGLAAFRCNALGYRYGCNIKPMYIGCSENQYYYCCGSGSNETVYCCPGYTNVSKQFSDECDCLQSMCPPDAISEVMAILWIVFSVLIFLFVFWYAKSRWCAKLRRRRNHGLPSFSQCCRCCSTHKNSNVEEHSDLPNNHSDDVHAVTDRPGEILLRGVESKGLQKVENAATREEPALSLNVNSLSQPVSNRKQPCLNPNGSNRNSEPPLYISAAIDGSPCSRPQIPHRSDAHNHARSRSRQRNGIHGNRSNSYNGNIPQHYIVDNHDYRSRPNGEEDWVVLENVRSFTTSNSSRSRTTGRLWSSYVSEYMESLPRSPPPAYSEQLNNFVNMRLYNSPPPSYHSDI